MDDARSVAFIPKSALFANSSRSDCPDRDDCGALAFDDAVAVSEGGCVVLVSRPGEGCNLRPTNRIVGPSDHLGSSGGAIFILPPDSSGVSWATFLISGSDIFRLPTITLGVGSATRSLYRVRIRS